MSRMNYITVAPRTKTGKWQILARRIGSKDRFQLYAEALTEIAADQIVRALNNDTHRLVLGEAAE